MKPARTFDLVRRKDAWQGFARQLGGVEAHFPDVDSIPRVRQFDWRCPPKLCLTAHGSTIQLDPGARVRFSYAILCDPPDLHIILFVSWKLPAYIAGTTACT